MFKRPMMGCLWLESAVDRVEVASLRKRECTWNQLNASTDKAPVRLFSFFIIIIFFYYSLLLLSHPIKQLQCSTTKLRLRYCAYFT